MTISTYLIRTTPQFKQFKNALGQLDPQKSLFTFNKYQIGPVAQLAFRLIGHLQSYPFLQRQMTRYVSVLTGMYLAMKKVSSTQLFSKIIFLFLLSKVIARQMMALQGVQASPHSSEAYLTLASCLMGQRQQIQMGNTVFDQQGLYLKAIDTAPQQGRPYFKLGNLLQHHQTVSLLNAKVMTKEQLYLKAIDLSPTDVKPYLKLASMLSSYQTIMLLNGMTFTKRALYLKVIQMDSACGEAYFQLGLCLKDHETVPLYQNIKDREELIVGKKELFNIAFDLGYC
ncbi:MAG: hypothetical protein QRY72_05720 [Candidatus Rhabdochlamydia sp.]